MQNKALAFPKAHAWAQKAAMMFFVGMSGCFAFAPYEQPYMLCLSLNMLLVRLWFSETPTQAMRFAWFWGWGFSIGNVFWVGNSMLVDAARFAWLLPIGTVAFPAALALYPAALGVAMGYARRVCGPISFTLGFVFLYSLIEWAQGHLFTGFPWNLSAYIWAAFPPMAQTAAFIGSYGLGLVTVLVFCLPTVALLRFSPFRFSCSIAGLLGCLFLLFLGGKQRLWTHPTQFHKDIYMRLVQPFIPQKEKGNPAYSYAHFASLVQQTRRPSQHLITHMLWPESAIPWPMTPARLETFPNLRTETPWHMLTGALYHDEEGKHWNAVLSEQPGKALRPVYYKTHLVPFGEYFPLRSWLEHIVPAGWLKKVTPGNTDFSKGPPPSVLHLEGTPAFLSLICYEAIFPIAHTPHRPEWLLSLTNDGWFGYSPGPYQHFASARMRSIEEGLPLVRVANNGISAIVDPVGRVIQSLGLNQQGVVDGFLPKALPATLFSSFGHTGFFILLMLLLIATICIGYYEYHQRTLSEQ